MIFEWFIDMVSFLVANPLVSTDKKNPTPIRLVCFTYALVVFFGFRHGEDVKRRNQPLFGLGTFRGVFGKFEVASWE